MVAVTDHGALHFDESFYGAHVPSTVRVGDAELPFNPRAVVFGVPKGVLAHGSIQINVPEPALADVALGVVEYIRVVWPSGSSWISQGVVHGMREVERGLMAVRIDFTQPLCLLRWE